MNQHLPSTPSAEGPTIPAAYRIYGEDAPDFEEGAGAVFWALLAGFALAGAVIGAVLL